MSQCYIHANLVKIHPPVHEISCKQENVKLTPTYANADAYASRIRTKNNMSPSPLVGDIIQRAIKKDNANGVSSKLSEKAEKFLTLCESNSGHPDKNLML